MPEPVSVRTGFKVIVNAAHRNGICVDCNIQMEVKDVELPLPELPSSRKYYCVACERNHFRTSGIGKLHDWETKYLKRAPRIVKRPVCPACGGMTGQLIARPSSLQAPTPPAGISFKCLWKFVLNSLFLAYLSSYHRRRVAYAEKNRPEKGKKILEKYRTGESSPETIWGAIKEIIRLKLRRA